MKYNLFGLIIICMLGLAACAPGKAGRPTDVFSPPGPTNTTPPDPARVPSTPTLPAIDPTPAERAALTALSDKYKIPIDQIHLVKTEPATWPTGCLGLVIPGVLCTKGPVSGFKITFEANGRQYEYHTNQDGSNVIDAAVQLALIRLMVHIPPHFL